MHVTIFQFGPLKNYYICLDIRGLRINMYKSNGIKLVMTHIPRHYFTKTSYCIVKLLHGSLTYLFSYLHW